MVEVHFPFCSEEGKIDCQGRLSSSKVVCVSASESFLRGVRPLGGASLHREPEAG